VKHGENMGIKKRFVKNKTIMYKTRKKYKPCKKNDKLCIFFHNQNIKAAKVNESKFRRKYG